MKTNSKILFKPLLLIVSITVLAFSCDNKHPTKKVNDCDGCPTYEGTKKTKAYSPIPNERNFEPSQITTTRVQKKSISAPVPRKYQVQELGDNQLSEYITEEEEESIDEDAFFGDGAGGYFFSKSEVNQPAGQVRKDVVKQNWNTESYNVIKENEFLSSTENPLSTFSIDVDNASYTNTRRFINNGQLPPKDAVRIEEFINYFSYDYKQPKGEHPFSINTEIGQAPWNEKHRLVHIGLQGKKYKFDEIEPMNLVFLLDVSGSMSDRNKLPLLKKSFEMLVSKMRPQDRIAITVYAGAAGLVLPSTSGADKQTILKSLDNLSAGGSTAGGAGIKLAYKIAAENFKENGVNRVILATDGDFNIGASSNGEMTRLIEEKREEGVFLTVLGFGMGNYKDSRMETIADNGNGNYFYIDNITESNKVLVDELGSTLYTIAKDVKLQVEFNPSKVQAYRLMGYENRMLKKEDFNDDKKDAGELGAGHTVTAIYEVIPTGVNSKFTKSVDELKYQIPNKAKNQSFGNELLTVKFRYKKPNETVSKLIVHSLMDRSENNNSDNFEFSAAVSGWGMLLRDSQFKQELDYAKVIELAQNGKGRDDNGYRAEFIKLVRTAVMLEGISSSK